MTDVANRQKMNAAERQLFEAALGDQQPKLVVRTQTRIDTGKWLGRSAVWLCVTGQQVVLFAVKKRHWIERASLADAEASWYCHVTGELVIEPTDQLTFGRLKLSPTEALGVLDCIETTNQKREGEPALATEN